MEPMPEVSHVVKNFGGICLGKKTVVRRYEDGGICEANVKKPVTFHSRISDEQFLRQVDLNLPFRKPAFIETISYNKSTTMPIHDGGVRLSRL